LAIALSFPLLVLALFLAYLLVWLWQWAGP
jgi:hypothetical protein